MRHKRKRKPRPEETMTPKEEVSRLFGKVLRRKHTMRRLKLMARLRERCKKLGVTPI